MYLTPFDLSSQPFLPLKKKIVEARKILSKSIDPKLRIEHDKLVIQLKYKYANHNRRSA